MGKCTVCEKDMRRAHSCEPLPVQVAGRLYDRHRHYGEERCGDCGVKHGGYHHPGCDLEDCPCCGLQLISCDCEIE